MTPRTFEYELVPLTFGRWRLIYTDGVSVEENW